MKRPPARSGPTPRFDLPGLLRSVDTKRVRQGLSWAALAHQVGVATSTIRRLATADDAEADGVLALLRWLEVAPEDYIDGTSAHATRLAPPGTGFVRVDMALVAAAQGDPAGARGRTRTSVQRLVAAAHRSGQSVASLTRLSET